MERAQVSEMDVTTNNHTADTSTANHKTLTKKDAHKENKDAQENNIFRTCSSSGSSEVDENQNIKEELDSDGSEGDDFLSNLEVS